MKTSPSQPRVLRLLLVSLIAVAIAFAFRITHNRAIQPTTQPTADIPSLEQQVRDNPDDVQIRMELGAAMFTQHRVDEAVSVCKSACRLAPNDPRPLNALARIEISQNNGSEALKYVQASLTLKQDDAGVWRALGMLVSRQDPPQALGAFYKATELDPKDATSWLQAGVIEMNRRQNIRGLHDLQRAASLNPGDLETQVELGNSANTNDAPTVAAAAFKKALSIKPDNLPAMLGDASTTLQVDPSPDGMKRAGIELDTVIAKSPSPEAFRARGHWKLMMKQYAAAVTDLKAAVQQDPGLATAHSMLAQCYTALGQPKLARQENALFMSTAPTSARSPVMESSAPK